MISLRQHVASLVAVFLALAVGIVLGGGPLAGDDDADDTRRAGPRRRRRPARDNHDDYADAFAAEGAPRLYANGLDGHASAILALPGAEPDQIKALSAQIATAGGAITGLYTAGESWSTPRSAIVDTESGQLTTQLVDPRVDATAPTYERMGQLLAMAMATDQPPPHERTSRRSPSERRWPGRAAHLAGRRAQRTSHCSLSCRPAKRAPEESLATRTVLSGLVNGMASNAAGVVVVGDEDSAEDGDLAALRECELVGPISTVDGIETTIGQVTAVLAMATVLGEPAAPTVRRDRMAPFLWIGWRSMKPPMPTKHVFVTGGVASSLGKGLTASSLGRLLRSRGLHVTMQKLDPYLNVDPGTMNPFQHGEVFVTNDGAETDLDIGHYERFLDTDLGQIANVTTGQVYSR